MNVFRVTQRGFGTQVFEIAPGPEGQSMVTQNGQVLLTMDFIEDMGGRPLKFSGSAQTVREARTAELNALIGSHD